MCESLDSCQQSSKYLSVSQDHKEKFTSRSVTGINKVLQNAFSKKYVQG